MRIGLFTGPPQAPLPTCPIRARQTHLHNARWWLAQAATCRHLGLTRHAAQALREAASARRAARTCLILGSST